MKYTVCEVWSDSGSDDLELYIFKDRDAFTRWLESDHEGYKADAAGSWFTRDVLMDKPVVIAGEETNVEFTWNIRVQYDVEVIE